MVAQQNLTRWASLINENVESSASTHTFIDPIPPPTPKLEPNALGFTLSANSDPVTLSILSSTGFNKMEPYHKQRLLTSWTYILLNSI